MRAAPLARCRTALLLLAIAAGSSLAPAAVLPGQGKEAAKVAAPAAAPPSEASQAAELRSRLAEAEKLLGSIQAPGGLTAGAPPGTPDQTLRLRQARTAFIVRTLTQQLADLDKLPELRSRRVALEAEIAGWKGMDEKPPYSIILADRLRSELHAAETKLSGLQSRVELLQQSSERALERIRTSELELRQLAERAERAGNGNDGQQIAWERSLAELLIRAARTSASATETARQRIDEEIAIARLEIDLATRKLQAVAAATQFGEDDLAQLRSALGAERGKLEANIDRLNLEHGRRRKAAEASRQALDTAKAALREGSASHADDLTRVLHLKRDHELKDARLQTTAMQLENLREMADLNRSREAIWEGRFRAHQANDAGNRMTVRDNAERLLVFLGLERRHVEQEYKVAVSRQIEVESGLEHISDPLEDNFQRETLKTLGERIASLQQTLAALDTNTTLARQIVSEFGGGSQRSWGERFAEWGVLARQHARAFWDFELVAVEDAIEVDGKRIVGTRSVTIGKSLSALLLIAAGYALAVLLARLAERGLIRYLRWLPAHAGIARLWLLTLELVILIVIVLTWVKIPITVFAFLGGAVAIGLGFGMQTLLKNLISGLMVLGERPFRIGDLVEVGGIRGNVTNIGLRASTISDVNGIETIIPNSTFIEQNLTNWTHTSGRVRFNVKVGVAYGSPVRVVTELLEACAARHGLVLGEPPPEVLFEDFASDALNFGLYYWLDIAAGVAPRRVASELRSMIEASFASKGIVIAFPQRDVHLDAAAPLPVRIVDPGAAAPQA